MFVFHDKIINEYRVYSTMKKISEMENISYHTLLENFSKKSKLRYDRKDFTIVRTEKVKR